MGEATDDISFYRISRQVCDFIGDLMLELFI